MNKKKKKRLSLEQVSMFAASGLKVDGLALHNEKYSHWKGVRSITRAGKFQVRT
jgi:AP-3 complex subunit mu